MQKLCHWKKTKTQNEQRKQKVTKECEKSPCGRETMNVRRLTPSIYPPRINCTRSVGRTRRENCSCFTKQLKYFVLELEAIFQSQRVTFVVIRIVDTYRTLRVGVFQFVIAALVITQLFRTKLCYDYIRVIFR